MIKSIKLKDFRNFKKKILDFSEKVTVIIGPNASGKTNIFEGLTLLSSGKSFKARVEEEMIGYDSNMARVRAELRTMNYEYREEMHSSNSIKHSSDLEVVLTRDIEGWPGKKLTVNGIPRRLIDFAGNFKTVLFGPWDMDLVTGPPSLRRKFLDTVLAQVDREYRRAILSYEKGLRQRNRLLFRIREEGLSRSQLLFWNQLLIKNGDYLSSARQNFIDFANSRPGLESAVYSLQYDRSVISETRLEQYAEEEVAAAATLVGPHRDDMQFTIYDLQFTKKRDLAGFGSRGEQRMGVLWLKLAELAFIEKKSVDSTSLTIRGESGRPTLLLDDILSELDHEHRKIVVELAKGQQTIITTADEHFIEGFKKASIIKL